MTAEIAILNKQAIAIAADSAVTLQRKEGQKIFTSANKLFALSRYHPVAIMVYGNANLMGVPWETVIKVYRTLLLNKEYPTLEDYARDFMGFLGKDARLFSDASQLAYIRDSVIGYMGVIRGEILERAEKAIAQSGGVSPDDMSKIILDTIKRHYDIWESCQVSDVMPSSFIEDILQKHSGMIREAIMSAWEKVQLGDDALNQLVRVAASLFAKFPPSLNNASASGVVIAGFGRDDIFPALQAFTIEGVINNHPKYKEDQHLRVGDTSEVAIVPFAQADVVSTFMEGVEPTYEQTIERFILEILHEFPGVVIDSLDALPEEQKNLAKTEWKQLKSKGVFDQYRSRLQQYRIENYVSQVMKVVAVLPKDELAAMAEALINLTSFKRRVSLEAETVGGPIDVAVISKGDGLVWIRRKHYFRPELNPQFFSNRSQEVPK